MRIDPKSGPTSDLTDDEPKPGILDLRRPPASGAHDVVVMSGRTRNVRVFTIGQVDPLHDAELQHGLDGAEHGRPAYAEAARPGLRDKLGRCEVALEVGDDRRQGPPRFGQSITGAIERDDDLVWICHVRSIQQTIVVDETVSH